MIDAVSEVALAQDEAFHREFFARLDHLPPGRDALIGVILSYLKVRSSPQAQGAPMSNTLDRSQICLETRREPAFSAWP